MRFWSFTICAFVLSVTAASSAFATETLQQRGRDLAQRLCGDCHAIGRRGTSPLPAAPRFRAIDDRVDLSQLPRRIQDGLLSGHQDMPMFRFTSDDADALVAYMRSIQGQ
jgi:mono/diheme cytochrome c family protein